MIVTKQMPSKEKLEAVERLDRLVEDFAPKVVKEVLGVEKLQELRNTWATQSEHILSEASDQEKYEIAYRNFLKKWVSANNLMEKYEGEVGTSKYLTAAIAGWKKQYSGNSFLLKTIWGLSPKIAFHKLASQLSYALQVFSPFTVSELTETRMTLTVDPCKIAETPEGSNFCVMACQNIIPSWLESEFDVKMRHNWQGKRCIVTFEPFNKK